MMPPASDLLLAVSFLVTYKWICIVHLTSFFNFIKDASAMVLIFLCLFLLLYYLS
jgi:hypothetical protein